MSEFWEQVWANIWSGWGPIFTIILFFVGLQMAKTFHGLGVSAPIVVLAYLSGTILVPLSYSVFVTLQKR